jgi:hypothetical protein
MEIRGELSEIDQISYDPTQINENRLMKKLKTRRFLLDTNYIGVS